MMKDYKNRSYKIKAKRVVEGEIKHFRQLEKVKMNLGRKIFEDTGMPNLSS